MDINIRYVLLVFLAIVLISCNNTGDPVDINNNNPTDGSYFMEYTGTQAPSVFTQYPSYYLAGNDDSRPIFVYGKDAYGPEN